MISVEQLAQFTQSSLNYQFKDLQLLQLAFTHRSAATPHNERLEFLGDAVLDLIISHILYQQFPNMDEGDLSRMRSWLVKKESLYEIGEKYQLAKYIRMGEGETRSGGHQRKSTIADTVEALIAAVYLDGEFSQVKLFVEQLFAEKLTALPEVGVLKDAKSRLQELLQLRHVDLPDYQLVSEVGKPHDKTFTVSCSVVKPEIVAYGEGASRRKAEQLAAQKVLEVLDKRN